MSREPDLPSESSPGFDVHDVSQRDSEREIGEFLERGWAEYHRAEGHDLTYDWRSAPMRLVARARDGRLVGIASGRYSAGVGHLSELMVAESWRGAGVGRSLLAAFERRWRAAGCHKLTVHTDPGGRAFQFYGRQGWKVEAILRRDKGGQDFARLYKFVEADTHIC